MLTPELIHEGNNIWRLKLTGDFSEYNYNLVRLTGDKNFFSQLDQSDAQRLIIDLANVDRLDSGGMMFLLITHKKAVVRNIPVTLQNPNSHMARLLRIMSFDHIFDIEYSEGDG